MNNDKLIVALDVPNFASAEKLVKTLSPTVKIFKVGKELFTACGPKVVEMVHASGAKVFLDLKFHDIPNTVAGACEAAASLGVFMLNVHASGGREMLVAASKAVQSAAKGEPSILLGVTVLTSLTQENLKEIGVSRGLEEQVKALALLSRDCGLAGVVASPKEVPMLRAALGDEFVLVTPGIRPSWAAAGDQKRITTPKQAVSDGASFIVVGRPITQDKDPKAAALKVLEEMA